MRALLLPLVFFSVSALACDFCMLGQGINPYLTANGRGVTVSEDYIQSNQVYDHSSKIDSQGKKETWFIQSLTGFMPVSQDLTLMLTIPYVSKTNLDSDPSGANPGTVTNGLADVSLTGRYTVWRSHSLESTWLGGVLFGAKLPTGKTDIHDGAGEPVDRHALPGTGSTDINAGFSGSFSSSDGYQFTADLVYTRAGRGKWSGKDHQYGDSINGSFKGFYRVSQSETKDRTVFLFTGPQFEQTGKETGTMDSGNYDDAKVNQSSGGQVLYWSLGIYAIYNPSVIINASLAQSIYHNMNYDKAFDADPAEDYKTNLSLTFLF